MKSKAVFHLTVLLVLAVASGSACPNQFWQPTEPPPVVFNAQPTLNDIVQVTNTNRALVTGIFSTNATISGKGLPSMRTSLAIGSPRHIRLRAGTTVTGQELDMGSNDQIFWVWIKRSQPPALYHGRHDQISTSAIGQMLPVRPEWLVEAIGLVSLDPNGQHQGPFRRNDGRLEVHTAMVSPDGPKTRVLVIDASSGWIHQQHLLDPGGQIVASATNSKHYRDPISGATLPRQTDINWPATGMQLRLELNEVQINPLELSGDLWVKPEYAGFPNVDVNRAALPPGTMPPSTVLPTAAMPAPAGRNFAPGILGPPSTAPPEVSHRLPAAPIGRSGTGQPYPARYGQPVPARYGYQNSQWLP